MKVHHSWNLKCLCYTPVAQSNLNCLCYSTVQQIEKNWTVLLVLLEYISCLFILVRIFSLRSKEYLQYSCRTSHFKADERPNEQDTK
jgi:hypothetical protein